MKEVMAMAIAVEREPTEAHDAERDVLRQLEAILQAAQPAGTGTARIVGASGEEVAIPASLLQILRQAAHYLAQDKLVSVVPLDKELTTQQASDILNVSRPYLVRLLEEGALPFTKVGTHRRVRFNDLMQYKQRRDAERRQGLAELTQMSQEFGLDEE